MGVTISPYVETVNDEIDAGYTQLKLYRDMAPDGAFSTVVDTVTLVEDTLSYDIEDPTGSAIHWYRYGFYNPSTLTLTTLSDPTRPDVVRLLDVMLAASQRAGAGFRSVCTSLGTETLLVDETLRDQAVSSDAWRGAYIYRPDAEEAGDRIRRLTETPFVVASGGLVPIRAWTNPPADGETYYLFVLLPPFSVAGAPYGWDAAARDGLQAVQFEDLVDVGEGTSELVSRFDLGPYLGLVHENDIRSVTLRRYNDDDGSVLWERNASKEGGFYYTQANGRSGLTLIVRPAPAAGVHVLVSAYRRDAEIYDPDDITGCPLRLAARATVWKAYEYLNTVHLGKYDGEEARARAAFEAEYLGFEVPAGGVDA